MWVQLCQLALYPRSLASITLGRSNFVWFLFCVHFICEETKYIEFMSQRKRFKKFIDPRWMKHQLAVKLCPSPITTENRLNSQMSCCILFVVLSNSSKWKYIKLHYFFSHLSFHFPKDGYLSQVLSDASIIFSSVFLYESPHWLTIKCSWY